MKFFDLLKYGDLIGKIASIYNGFRHTPVGGQVQVPRVVFEMNGQRWESDPHQARRIT